MSAATDNYKHCLLLTEQEKKNNKEFAIRGFQEVLFSVRDLEKSKELYATLGGWELLAESELPRETLDIWKLPNTCTANEAILHNSGDDTGFLRLVQFEGMEQKHIRSSGQSWDTGGIYDVDVRVVDIKKSFEEFQAAGWTGYADITEYEFGKFHIAEVLVRGQEDIVFALIQRFKPKLEGYPNLRKMSHIFNSSQVVRDMEIAKSFYKDILGFEIYMEEMLQGSEKDSNVFGMPQNLYKSIERKICILNPQGINWGSVELLELKGAQGRDFSDLAVAPNLGILLLRFPVYNIQKFDQHLKRHSIKSEIQKSYINPYGLCHVIALQSPDGAWLEFIEAI